MGFNLRPHRDDEIHDCFRSRSDGTVVRTGPFARSVRQDVYEFCYLFIGNLACRMDRKELEKL